MFALSLEEKDELIAWRNDTIAELYKRPPVVQVETNERDELYHYTT